MEISSRLFIAALMPVLKVVIMTLVGTFLAVERVNILGSVARKHLNIAVFYVFTPALIASSLAQNINFRGMVLLWFMPLNILLTFIVGSFLGWLVIKITKAPRHLRGLVIGCCSAGNLGNLPLILVPAVCKEKGTPFGNSEVCQEHGLSYASLSMAFGAIYLWLYVYNIVRVYSKNEFNEPKSEVQTILPISNSDEEAPEVVSNGSDNNQKETGRDNEVVVFLVKIKEGLGVVVRKLKLKKVFAPATVGAIIGFIIGAIPPFRKALIGASAPLRVIQDSAYLIGGAAIPAGTLIAGANLLKGLKGSRVKLSILVGIIAARYIILPIIGVVTVKSAIHLGFVRRDPLYQFILMLQFALPPAIGIGTMTQLFEAGQSECSVILLTTYALASIAMTLWSMFFMWLIGR